MNCKQVVEFLMDYVDGELPENVKMCFDMHLQLCPPCADYLHTYRKTVMLVKTCGEEDLAPSNCREMPDDLVRMILAVCEQTKPCE